MIHTLVQWLLDTIGAMGYPGIFLLMAMESSIIPVPSELVMPPAGYLAYLGKMNMAVAILCGTAGSLIGAYVNYFVSHYLGRPLILKYGKYFEQLLQVVLATEEFGRRCACQRSWCWCGVVGEPDPILEEAKHQVLPCVGVAGLSWSRSDAWLGVGDGVEEAVVRDAGCGVVPHGGCSWGGGSLSEHGCEPFGWFGLQAPGRLVGCRVDSPSVEVSITRLNATGGESEGPLPFGVRDEHAPVVECVGRGLGEGDGGRGYRSRRAVPM